MNDDIDLDRQDKDLVTDLILQRTGAFLEIPGANVVLNNWFAHGDREGLYDYLIRTSRLDYYITETLKGLREEAALISVELPSDGGSLISIGPGNGMIELVLAKTRRISELLLVDIERNAHHHHGYNQQGAGYADLKRTKGSMVRNLNDTVNVLTWNPKKQPAPKFKFDFLISILSMGFHYPCDEYASFILDNSKNGSVVIIDKRKGVPDNGFDVLSKDCNIKLISSNAKSERLKITLQENIRE